MTYLRLSWVGNLLRLTVPRLYGSLRTHLLLDHLRSRFQLPVLPLFLVEAEKRGITDKISPVVPSPFRLKLPSAETSSFLEELGDGAAGRPTKIRYLVSLISCCTRIFG